MRLPSSSSNGWNGRLVVVALIALAQAAVSQASPRELVERSIESAARQYLLAQANRAGLTQVAVDITVLPRRTEPAVGPCRQQFQVEPVETRSVARMRFAAVCRATPGWRVEYVVNGRISADVVIAKSALPAGKAIGPEDLTSERRDISAAPDATSDIGQIIGKASKRPLRSGDVISQRWLADAVLVKRGSVVSILARQAEIEVQVEGEVLEPGHRDDVVSVRNKVTGKIIRARVTSASTVEPAGLPAQ